MLRYHCHRNNKEALGTFFIDETLGGGSAQYQLHMEPSISSMWTRGLRGAFSLPLYGTFRLSNPSPSELSSVP